MVAPTPGAGGELSISYIDQSSLYLHWIQATDNRRGALTYAAYFSLNNNITRVDDARQNGILVAAPEKNIMAIAVSGLQPDTSYWLNVIVSDKKGNDAAYTSINATTLPLDTPSCGDGNLNGGEECDDGNNTSGDGCDSMCRIESEPPSCGDGVCNFDETCYSCEADCGSCVGTFDCLETAVEVQQVTGHYEEKFSPEVAAGKAFDARTADFLNYQVKWGMIDVEANSSERGMCWAGGYVYSDKPWDASWDDHKDLAGLTRNSAAISNRAYEMTITGLHYFNVHDGDRTNNAYSWVVQHNWGEYVRDDCIENDHLHSGRVYDTLFDGCNTGISTRPSSSDSSSDGTGEIVELDRVLLRMQPMPYPYKWTEKPGIIGADGEPYNGTGIPYGHGNIFKIENDDINRNPHFSIRNSVFLVTHFTTAEKVNFPPEQLIDACENNTIVWLGQGDYPGTLPDSKFPNCFNILTGEQGREYWVEKVTDWHIRHPNVGSDRKPTSPGNLEFPKIF